jgi:endonuclease-3
MRLIHEDTVDFAMGLVAQAKNGGSLDAPPHHQDNGMGLTTEYHGKPRTTASSGPHGYGTASIGKTTNAACRASASTSCLARTRNGRLDNPVVRRRIRVGASPCHGGSPADRRRTTPPGLRLIRTGWPDSLGALCVSAVNVFVLTPLRGGPTFAFFPEARVLTVDELPKVVQVLEGNAKTVGEELAVDRRKKDPYKVLVSCILSLRTKEETTRVASLRLLTRAPTPERLARMSVGEIKQAIWPVGFSPTKAKRLKEIGRILCDQYAGGVPDTMENLLKLPGVGRKTANIVLSVGFGRPAIAVDTHVHRITNRWGFVRTTDPAGTEMVLRDKLPERYWLSINGLLVIYGRTVCTPISPFCSRCELTPWCDRVGVTKSR